MEKVKEGYIMPDYPSYRKENASYRTIMIVVVTVSLFIALSVFYISNKRIAEMEEALLERDSYEIVLDKGTGSAYLGRREEITPELRKAEFEKIAKTYFHNMYGFNKHTYEDRMKVALSISGEVGNKKFLEYENQDIYSKLVNEDLRLIAKVDSVKTLEWDINVSRGYLFGHQRFVKPLGEGIYRFIVEFKVEDIGGRVIENLSGASVESFNVKLKERVQLKDTKEY